jgi:uncharacterized repeat protein (TIGR01451 family)
MPIRRSAQPRCLPARLLPPAGLVLALGSGSAAADEQLMPFYNFSGNADYFATGAAMAIDGPDNDSTNVDVALNSAITTVTANDIPLDAMRRDAFLYWGGSITNDNCVGDTIDKVVTFTPPGGAVQAVMADVCYCSDAAALSYDIQLCRADVSQYVDTLVGDYEVGDFNALIDNGSTNNASFSIVLVYSADSLPVRSIAIYDGLLTMWNQGVPETPVELADILIDDPPAGDLTWYALEGDIGGEGLEGVSVVGSPGNGSVELFDLLNPIDNPMNHTINTTMPPQVDALGVDIDEFDISAALTAGDTKVTTTYRGGDDKYWIAYNVIGVNIFAPDFITGSSKTWELQIDADQSGAPTPGDWVRYTIHLANVGNVVGSVEINDTMPSQVSEWMLIDDGGADADATMGNNLKLSFTLDANESADVVLDVKLAPESAGTSMINVVGYQEANGGPSGAFEAMPVPIGQASGDGDGDGDGDPGDGDGDPPGDGDGDPDTGESGEGSGEDGSTSTSGPSDGGSTTGVWQGGDMPESGCSCSSEPRSPTAATLGLLALACFGAAGSRRKR